MLCGENLSKLILLLISSNQHFYLFMNFSKHSLPFCSLVMVITFVLTVNSCEDQHLASQPEPVTSQISASAISHSAAVIQDPFNKTVGRPIDRLIAIRWIGNFATANPNSSCSEYFIQASALQKIMGNNNCVGISLYYAQDTPGNLHIIPIGVDGAGKVISSKTIMVQNSELDWSVAW